MYCRNQANGSKLMLYKPLIYFNSQLKQMYISNKTECFSYKGECGVHGRMHIEAFKKSCLELQDKQLWTISKSL